MSGIEETQKDRSGIRDLLRRVIGEAGAIGIPGSQLAAQIRKVDPNFTPSVYGAQSLRALVAATVPEATEIRRAGTDVVYALEGGSEPAPANESLWRVWASPRSPNALAVTRDGRVRTIPRSGTQQPDEVRIEPVTEQAHRDIAQAFLDSDTSALQSLLADALKVQKPSWWRDWVLALRQQPDVAQRWQEHRLTSLRRLLQSRIDETVPAEGRAPAIEQITASRRRVSSTGGKAAHPPPTRDDKGVPRRSLVTIVQAVVARMEDDELRRLNLPLGLVLEAVGVRVG